MESSSFQSLVYSPQFCFGEEPECKGQIANLSWGMGPCQWNKYGSDACREIQIWGTLPAPATDYPHSTKGGDIYVSLPSSLFSQNKSITDAHGKIYGSGTQAQLVDVNSFDDSKFLKFHCVGRLNQKWQNSQIHSSFVFN